MLYLIIGLLLFLGMHSLAIFAPAQRDRLVASYGRPAFMAVYSLISLAGLVLIVYGYGQARLDPVVLYQPPAFLRHVAMLLMLIVFPGLLAAYLPGKIQGMLVHPMLVAVKAWALAHLLVNGMLADVLLFGGFLVWAVVDRISLKRRPESGAPQLPTARFNDLIVVVGGIGVYLLFVFWLHPLLFGVPVM